MTRRQFAFVVMAKTLDKRDRVVRLFLIKKVGAIFNAADDLPVQFPHPLAHNDGAILNSLVICENVVIHG